MSSFSLFPIYFGNELLYRHVVIDVFALSWASLPAVLIKEQTEYR